MKRHVHRPPIAAALMLLAAACAPAASPPPPSGPVTVPIDPARPGDAVFAEGLTHYRQAESDQAAAWAARRAGDTATALADFALAVPGYGLAQGKFDQLQNDPTLCPAVSIRCDNAAYLAGRSSYELGIAQHAQALLVPDAALLPTSQGSFADARARLDAMLSAFPASNWVDSAAYFGGRARYELAKHFGVGSYAEAEPLFERAYGADPVGTWADNALYYDGRCEFEEGLGQLSAESAFLALGDLVQAQSAYDAARALFDQATGAEGALLARFATSSYRDNAAYYLGRAWFEKPTPDAAPGVAPGAVPDTERVANLGNARDTLGTVVAIPLSPFWAGALYWRGRTHYALWFHQTGSAAELDMALADFHAVPGASVWRDNALYYAVKSWVKEGALAGACDDYGALQTDFPASSYTAKAKAELCAFLTANTLACPAGGVSFTCP